MHRKTIENLSKGDHVIISKQGKGRRVVLMDKDKYTEKCMLLLKNNLKTWQWPYENDRREDSENIDENYT